MFSCECVVRKDGKPKLEILGERELMIICLLDDFSNGEGRHLEEGAHLTKEADGHFSYHRLAFVQDRTVSLFQSHNRHNPRIDSEPKLQQQLDYSLY